jgi:hypothetical protein
MARLDPNGLIGILHGRIGDLVLVRQSGGRIIVRARPDRTAAFTPSEKGNQSAFAKAAGYVRRIRQEPEQYAVYEEVARATGRRACDLAHADFRHAPVIRDIDAGAYRGQSGEPIGIEATDDFGVIRLEVLIMNLAGVVLEQGALVPEKNQAKCVYLTHTRVASGQTVAIQVLATDRPGNTSSKLIYHPLVP